MFMSNSQWRCQVREFLGGPSNLKGNSTWLDVGFPCGSAGKESACNAGDLGSTPGLGRSSGEGNGNPLQYSCLENSMDREVWRATVCGVAKSHTQLSNSHTHSKALILVQVTAALNPRRSSVPRRSPFSLWKMEMSVIIFINVPEITEPSSPSLTHLFIHSFILI